MKRTLIYIIYIGLMCLLLTCSDLNFSKKQPHESYITIEIDVPNQLKKVGITYYVGKDALSSVGIQNADGSLQNQTSVAFRIPEEDFPDDRSDFAAKVTITDAFGVSYGSSAPACIPDLGKDYTFLLKSEDGQYSLYSREFGDYIDISPIPVE